MIAGCQFVEANSDRQRVPQSQMNTFETTFKDESWCYLTKMTLAGCLNRNFSGKKNVDSFEAKRVITLHHGPCLLGVIIITCCVIFNKKKENKSLRVLWIKICSLPAAKFLLTATIFAGNEINQTTTCGYGAPNTFWFYFFKNNIFLPFETK